MGAHDFETTSLGKNATEAFQAAQGEALYQYGHDPYNGTISTVAGFREFKLPKGLKFRDFHYLVWACGYKTPTKPPIRRKFENDRDRRDHERAKKQWQLWDKLSPQEQRIVLDAGQSIRKWECCVAVERTGKDATEIKKRFNRSGARAKVYTFFGMAAC